MKNMKLPAILINLSRFQKLCEGGADESDMGCLKERTEGAKLKTLRGRQGERWKGESQCDGCCK
jgi:hypothetical protein